MALAKFVNATPSAQFTYPSLTVPFDLSLLESPDLVLPHPDNIPMINILEKR